MQGQAGAAWKLLCVMASSVACWNYTNGWRARVALAPEWLNALRYAATIESIGCLTGIEGSKLTYCEVERLPSNMEIIFHAFGDIQFTENHLKQLHRGHLHRSQKELADQ
jgi:hypothetical protein